MDHGWRGRHGAYVDCFVTLMVALLSLSSTTPPTPAKSLPSIFPLVVDLYWDQGGCKAGGPNDADVDLWTKAPGGEAVGWSNKTGYGMALTRDDLGPGIDPDSRCREEGVAYVLRPGEYVVNAFLYSTRSNSPIPVEVIVRLNATGKQETVIIHTHGVLKHAEEEITLARFTLDESGHLKEGSVNDLPYPMEHGRQ